MHHALFVAWMSLTQPSACTTHVSCDMNAACTCTVPARSAGSMHFYWEVVLYRDTHVTCTLESTPTHYSWLHALSVLPEGVQAQCVGDCMRYPTRIVFRTDAMSEAQGTLVLKYEVPPSDMPSRSSIRCQPSP